MSVNKLEKELSPQVAREDKADRKSHTSPLCIQQWGSSVHDRCAHPIMHVHMHTETYMHQSHIFHNTVNHTYVHLSVYVHHLPT